MCHGSASNVDVAFNSFAQVQKKTIRKPKHNSMQSLSISRAKTRGFTAQGSVNKRLNQIELQKMKGKHEWGNEGADVVSDQITISTGYWRGKRLIELFYHTESLRLSLSPCTQNQYHYQQRWQAGKPHMWKKNLSWFRVTGLRSEPTVTRSVFVPFLTHFKSPFVLFCFFYGLRWCHTDLW